MSHKPVSYDIVILGAGPAGCSAAINLLPGLRVAIIDRTEKSKFKIGESLAPASKRILKEMQLWDNFITQGHQPCYGNRSVWASNSIDETDFLQDIDGHGWHLDREKFENQLRDHALKKGTSFYHRANFKSLSKAKNGWQIGFKKDNKISTIEASIVIDAGGRAAPLSKQLKIHRINNDHMVCSWIRGHEKTSHVDAGFSYVQATKNGWWYTAPIPGEKRILSFHTDTRISTLSHFSNSQTQLNAAKQQSQLAELLNRCEFTPDKTQGRVAAHSSTLTRYSGGNWLAVGDAAMCFDPISSQGIFNSLYTGLYAAKTIRQYLDGKLIDLCDYNQALQTIWVSYLLHADYWYSIPERWKQSPFWKLKSALN